MIEEGIYIEEREGTLGVAGTSKPIVYRNLWATKEVKEERIILQLLDDKANPTGLTEEVTPKQLAERFTYRPVKPETWAALKAKLEQMRQAAPKPPQARKPQAKKKTNAATSSKTWWQT